MLLPSGAGYALTYLCQLKLPDPVYAVTSTSVDPALAEEPHNILPSRRARCSQSCHVCYGDRSHSDISSMCTVKEDLRPVQKCTPDVRASDARHVRS